MWRAAAEGAHWPRQERSYGRNLPSTHLLAAGLQLLQLCPAGARPLHERLHRSRQLPEVRRQPRSQLLHGLLLLLVLLLIGPGWSVTGGSGRWRQADCRAGRLQLPPCRQQPLMHKGLLEGQGADVPRQGPGARLRQVGVPWEGLLAGARGG